MAKMSSVFWAAVTLGAAVSAPNAAWAGSVAYADLAGRKICWSGGADVAYGKDGFFYATQMGNGTWRLAGDRLIMVGVGGEYDWMITKQGGVFRLQGITVKDVYSGKYCN